MTSTVLAVNDLGEPTGSQFDFLQYGIIAGITIALGSIFLLWVSSRWLVRAFRLHHRASHPMLRPAINSLPQLADARAHLDAAKRHLASLEEQLYEIESQLCYQPIRGSRHDEIPSHTESSDAQTPTSPLTGK